MTYVQHGGYMAPVEDIPDEDLDRMIRDANQRMLTLAAERNRRKEAKWQEGIAANPWRIADIVTTKMSKRNYYIIRINPRSVIVRLPHGEERIPLRQVLPQDHSKDDPARGF